VKGTNGKKIPIEVSGDDSIHVIKQKIEEKEGIYYYESLYFYTVLNMKGTPANQQELMLKGRKLNDDQTVAGCKLEKGAVLDILLTKMIDITAKTQPGKRIPLKVMGSESILEIKRRIEEKESLFLFF
jgi:hypothetical protein